MNYGDLIKVVWLDASEQFKNKIESPEAITTTLGVFLGWKGRINKHIVIVNEFVYFPEDQLVLSKFICIPSKMILKTQLVKEHVMSDKLLKKMIRITKKHKISDLRGGVGWYETNEVDFKMS